jgi:16S rRNA (uracil1498-N3)-methyltransferase
MRHRIYTTDPIIPGSTLTIGGDEFHHAAHAVRLRENEGVEIFDGKGMAASAKVTAIGRESIVVEIGSFIESREAKTAITLAMAIIQLDKFELVLQKATELGVRAIVPVVTDRAEVRPERYRGKRERWEKIIFEAVKQSGRASIPRLEEPAPFIELIARGGLRIVFDADAAESPLPSQNGELTLFIGPEGGWSAQEMETAREHGCAFRHLGERRLRAETAAIAALVKIAVTFDEL